MNPKHTRIPALLLCLLFSIGPTRAQSNEGSAFDQSKFVPDISFILDASAVARDMKDQRYYSLATPGFGFPFPNELGSAGGNAHRGMNFNYGELSLYSVVDPYFDLFAVIGLAPESAGLEEAYFSTTKLPYGLKLKAGKFLASFGRVNEQHEHFWDFANRPLIAAALFGEEGLNETGVQLTWVAPTSTYLVLGAQVMNGENERSFGTAGFTRPGVGVAVDAVQGPNLYIGYIRTSFDIGEASFLLGVSDAAGKTRGDQASPSIVPAGAAVDANTNIVGVDATVKYSLDAIRFVSFQSEFMYRTVNGTLYTTGPADEPIAPRLEKRHSGWYAQAAAKLDQRWEIGVRYDLLMQNDVSVGGTDQHQPSTLPRYSAMIEYFPTEFSRFRLQFDRDESLFVPGADGWSRQPSTQILLQANLMIGAHGAHAF